MDFILDVTAQGLAYSILAIGVLLTYQVLDYADLTVEGSFPLGAAAGAMCVMHGINPFLSLIVAFIAGLAAGYATGFLHLQPFKRYSRHDGAVFNQSDCSRRYEQHSIVYL